MTQHMMYFAKYGRAGINDVQGRAPELASLRNKRIAVFGLGCLGAPSAIEFARAGIGALSLLDHDVVNPGTVGRWPLGLSVAGKEKVEALSTFLEQNYPLTALRRSTRWLGFTNLSQAESDMDVVDELIHDADLIYDATAEIGVQHYLSDAARQIGVPYVGVVGSHGGWGEKVVSIVPDRTPGCWYCFRAALQDETIMEPPADPRGEFQPAGCGDLSFTGAGFDMLLVALTGVRVAVSILSRGVAEGYPELDGDVTTISLRDNDGKAIAPSFRMHVLEKHSDCPNCCSKL